MESCRRIAVFLSLGVAAACLAAGAANAQQVSRGAFTLPRTAELGKHTLAKGSYKYTVRETGMTGALVTITSASDSSRAIEMMGLQGSPDASLEGGGSTLVVTRHANGDILKGIYLADLGAEFMFPAQAKRKAVAAENSKSGQERELTLRIPIRKAAK